LRTSVGGVADPARPLLEHLRATLGEPRLGFAEAPAPLAGGFDTRIYTFRLTDAPPEFSPRLVLRLVRHHLVFDDPSPFVAAATRWLDRANRTGGA